MLQTTIKKSIECSGIGLHGGRKVSLRLRPAPEDTGIVFTLRRPDGSTRFLRPSPRMVHASGLATTLKEGDDTLATVEHLLAAIRGLGIDNIYLEVHGPEIPIMDGSAASFVLLLRTAGLKRQRMSQRVLALTDTVHFEQNGKSITAAPYDGFFVDYTIDFSHPLIGRQRMELDIRPETFTRELAKARTFGFLSEVEMLQQRGLALGGSLDNAVVLDDYTVVNAEGLRFADEFVRHKILDFIGDMALLELPLAGRFTVHCSGHALNNAFLRHLDEHRDDYLQEISLSEPYAEEELLIGPAEAPEAVPATA